MTARERERAERDAEKFRELESDIAWHKEQLTEAVRLIRQLQLPDGLPWEVTKPLQDEVFAFLDQNSDLAKGNASANG